MSQKFSVYNFEWSEDISQFNEGIIKSSHEESDEGYFLEVHLEFLEKLHELNNDLPFSPKRMKIQKFETLVTNLHNKTEYVIYIKNLTQALNHELLLKNFD